MFGGHLASAPLPLPMLRLLLDVWFEVTHSYGLSLRAILREGYCGALTCPEVHVLSCVTWQGASKTVMESRWLISLKMDCPGLSGPSIISRLLQFGQEMQESVSGSCTVRRM